MTLLSKIPDLKDILRTDIDAAYNGDPAALSRNEIIVAYPFVEAIAVQRMAHELYRNQVAPHSTNHDRVGSFQNRNGSSPGRQHWESFFH